MIHPERDDWARQLTALRQQMAEQAASLDASGEFPWRNIDHLRAGGWLSLAVPPSCGGAGASLAQLQQVIAAILRRRGRQSGPAAAGHRRHRLGRAGDSADRLHAVSPPFAAGGK
ncbi:TPA: acyl-CoA dehydrogenase family protein [Klebsiella pneumoniae]|nr:acyl-CoA dehydrogenase family protein [Klebsiella pneumoniae]